jgi:TonB family protein
MRYFLSFLFAVVSVTGAFAQKGRVKKCISENNSQWHEIFFVLKTDSSVKDGPYQKWVGEEKVVQGNYRDNEKHGRWTYMSGGVTIAEGFYSHNMPVQIWKFYSSYHDLLQVYDFSRDSMLFFDKQLEESFYPAKKSPAGDAGTTPPILIGGQTFLNYMLKYYVHYPELAASLKKQGTVTVEFGIDTAGMVNEAVIENKIGFGMDEEALHFISQLNKFWLPAKVNGQKTLMRYSLPVSFIYRKY